MSVTNKILVNLSLEGNEIQNAVLQNLATPPSSPKTGAMYYDTADNSPKIYNGTQWVAFGGESTNTTYTFTAYHSNNDYGFTWTDSEGRSGDIVILTIDDTLSDDSTNAVQNKIVKAYIDNAIESVKSQLANGMTYKGTVTTEAPLPTSEVKVGDTYKVAEAGTYANIKAKIGDIFIASKVADSVTWDYIPSGDEKETLVYKETNTTLTAESGGYFKWTITSKGAANAAINGVSVFDNATGEQVFPNISISGNIITITIVGTGTLAANTYEVRYLA